MFEVHPLALQLITLLLSIASIYLTFCVAFPSFEVHPLASQVIIFLLLVAST